MAWLTNFWNLEIAHAIFFTAVAHHRQSHIRPHCWTPVSSTVGISNVVQGLWTLIDMQISSRCFLLSFTVTGRYCCYIRKGHATTGIRNVELSIEKQPSSHKATTVRIVADTYNLFYTVKSVIIIVIVIIGNSYHNNRIVFTSLAKEGSHLISNDSEEMNLNATLNILLCMRWTWRQTLTCYIMHVWVQYSCFSWKPGNLR